MAIKSFAEMMAIDLTSRTSKKPTFKKNAVTGKYDQTGELDYINWADCLSLLHEHGAEKVLFGNIKSVADHPVFLLNNSIPFLRIFVDVDGDRRELDYPVIDGSNDLSMEKLQQSDVHNATQRGFTKCVAINWGLGLSMWQKEEKAAPEKHPLDEPSAHSIDAVKIFVEQLITGKMQSKSLTQKELCDALGVNEKTFLNTMAAFGNIALLRSKLLNL
jgi:hypothetical protein